MFTESFRPSPLRPESLRPSPLRPEIFKTFTESLRPSPKHVYFVRVH